MKVRLILLTALFYILPSSSFALGLTYEEQIYDFGHVGIDFEVHHTFTFVNRADIPIKIKDIIATCDCTAVSSADTLVQPGDTAFFNLTFHTKDYYGPTNKSFSVMTDHPELPKLEYFYLSIVGQWFNGLKPTPISLFFLPSKKSKIIHIHNKFFDNISIVSVSHSSQFISSQVISENAKVGKSVEVEVKPKKDLKPGTYQTTVTIILKTDNDENNYFTIPVKIVVY